MATVIDEELMALHGSLTDISVADLIQHICLDQKTAQLTIDHQHHQANLFFQDGAILHATLDQNEGEEVVYEILTWAEGNFTLDMGIEPPTVTIRRSWTGLLLEGARRLDESNQFVTNNSERKSETMANIKQTLDEIMQLDGAIAAAVVDWQSGMTLGTVGSGMNIEVAAAGNTNVIRAKLEVMKDLKLKGGIEDILITLTDQYHLIRTLGANDNLFIYVAFKRAQANLGLARHKLAEIGSSLAI
jgi:hypothetical protein